MSRRPPSPTLRRFARGGGRLASRRGRARLGAQLGLAGGLCLLPLAGVAAPPGLDQLPAPDDAPPAQALPELGPPANSAAPSAKPDPGTDTPLPAQVTPAPAPEPDPRFEIKRLKKAKWIKHEILPGERLDEIAARYEVRREALIRWNKLDKNKPRIYAGRKLAVYTKHIPPPVQQLVYTVQFGDTWDKVAKAHRVDAEHLRARWNPKVPRRFKAGQQLVIWIDPLDDPDLLRRPEDTHTRASAGTSTGGRSGSTSPAAASLPTIAISSGSVSVGKPNRGKILSPLALPENPALYTRRKPDESYGSSHTLHNLQFAIANFRQATGYGGELVIGAISKKGGGRLKPHSSHQSGRDVDIRLPLARAGGDADHIDDVDWDATWGLIQALVATGEVQYIFLTTDRQKRVYEAAKRAGASKDMLERLLQYPNKKGSNHGVVRHEPGHTAHIHVRFSCAANETRCESY